MATKEKWKYDEIYASRKWDWYGHKCHGKPLVSFLLKEAKSVLDIGCGHNELCVELRRLGMFAVGVDFACPDADSMVDVTDYNIVENLLALSEEHLPEGKFDFVTAFDVLEHIPEWHLNQVFRNMIRWAQNFAFSIADFNHHFKDSSKGVVTLHPTVKPKDWWIKKIQEYGTIDNREDHFITGKWN